MNTNTLASIITGIRKMSISKLKNELTHVNWAILHVTQHGSGKDGILPRTSLVRIFEAIGGELEKRGIKWQINPDNPSEIIFK